MPLDLIIFDLDETLYPRDAGLLQEVGNRIQLWLRDRLSLSWEEAAKIRRSYYQQYGTTLGGLVAELDVDIDDYLVSVHDIVVEEYVEPHSELAAMLAAIPLRKAIYTNATAEYGWRVLDVLGIANQFETIVGIEEVDLRNKPYLDAYERALTLLDAVGPECMMVEDTVRNLKPAKALGLTTVLVDAEPEEYVDFVVENVLEVQQIVNGLLHREEL